MIIVCQECSCRLQVDDERVSAHAVTQCPKCKSEINLGTVNPASEKSAFALGGSPATDLKRFEHKNPAPPFDAHTEAVRNESASSDIDKFMQMMNVFLGQRAAHETVEPGERPPWKKRKALVCSPSDSRDKIARLLTQGGYQAFVALDTKQAVERMRENQLDIVLLDPQFDSSEQGAAFVMREVNVLRPNQRRRLFFVLLSPSLRTMDSHGAFLNNVNAIINLKEVDDLAKILDHALRDYNELYKDFNAALQVTAI